MKRFLYYLVLFSVNLYSIAPRTDGMAAYGTHAAPLLTAVAHTTGPILELGCGDYSTPLLHAVCSGTKRLLLSVENNSAWLNLFLDMTTNWHKFALTKDWNTVGNDIHWSVVFVDNAPGEQRVQDIARLRKNTDIFVAHDTQEVGYGYYKILPSFKYSYVYTRYTTTTTVVSDVIDVRTFFNA